MTNWKELMAGLEASNASALQRTEDYALAKRKEEMEKRVELFRKLRVEQRLREIKDQVWGKGEVSTNIWHSEDYRSGTVGARIYYSVNVSYTETKDVDIGGTGSMELYQPNFQRKTFQRDERFISELSINVSPGIVKLKDEAYFTDEFALYDRKGYVVLSTSSEVGGYHLDSEAGFEQSLVELCLKRAQAGMSPIDVLKWLKLRSSIYGNPSVG